MLPWSSLFQILQFPRCIQDLYIVSLLFQAVAADCFLFKHKSHLLTPNCCVCLFLQISIPLLHLLKSRIMHIQDLCTWHYSCKHVGSSFMKHILYSNEALKRFHLKNDQNLFVCLQTWLDFIYSTCRCTMYSDLCASDKSPTLLSPCPFPEFNITWLLPFVLHKRHTLSHKNWSRQEKYLLVMHWTFPNVAVTLAR